MEIYRLSFDISLQSCSPAPGPSVTGAWWQPRVGQCQNSKNCLQDLILDFRAELHKIFRIVHMKFDCLFIAVPLSSEILKQNMDIYTEIDGGQAGLGLHRKGRSHSISTSLSQLLSAVLASQFCVISAIFEEDVANCYFIQ